MFQQQQLFANYILFGRKYVPFSTNMPNSGTTISQNMYNYKIEIIYKFKYNQTVEL